ncbi:MAG: hypothetical protein ACR652_06190 [Methylocystis sp.]|uniref:hypothetical protein n=1 Tax=Methylocystis sp. TaxID=1911079 RepID=UPI003DA1F520
MSNINNNSNSNWRLPQSPDPHASQTLGVMTRIDATPYCPTIGASSRPADVIGPLTGPQADYDNKLGRIFGSVSGSLPPPGAQMEQPKEALPFEEWYDSIWNDSPPHAQTGDQAKAENQSLIASHLISNASTTTVDIPIRRPLQPGTYKRGPLNVRPISNKNALLRNPHLKLHARVLDPYFQWRVSSPDTQPSSRHPARKDDLSHDHTSSLESSSCDDSALTSESDSDQIPAQVAHEQGRAEFLAPDPIGVRMSNSTTPPGDDFPLPDPIPSRPQPTAATTANNRDLVDRHSVQPEARTHPSALQPAQNLRDLQVNATPRPTPAIIDPQFDFIAMQMPAPIKLLAGRKVRLGPENYAEVHGLNHDPSEIPAFRELSASAQEVVHAKLNLLRNKETYKKSTRYLDTENHAAIYFIYANYKTSIAQLASVFGIAHASVRATIMRSDMARDWG